MEKGTPPGGMGGACMRMMSSGLHRCLTLLFGHVPAGPPCRRELLVDNEVSSSVSLSLSLSLFLCLCIHRSVDMSARGPLSEEHVPGGHAVVIPTRRKTYRVGARRRQPAAATSYKRGVMVSAIPASLKKVLRARVRMVGPESGIRQMHRLEQWV